MFGPFRATSPLSGGLLWYVAFPPPIAQPPIPHLLQPVRLTSLPPTLPDLPPCSFIPSLLLTPSPSRSPHLLNLPPPPSNPKLTTNPSPSRKIPWRLSRPQKARHRKRLRAVDTVISVLDNALAKAGLSTKSVERWKAEMPREEEMVPKDKYTIFDRKEKRYRKGVHSMSIFLSLV